jgi:hypothetical protein
LRQFIVVCLSIMPLVATHLEGASGNFDEAEQRLVGQIPTRGIETRIAAGGQHAASRRPAIGFHPAVIAQCQPERFDDAASAGRRHAAGTGIGQGFPGLPPISFQNYRVHCSASGVKCLICFCRKSAEML